MRNYLDDFHKDLDDIKNAFSVLQALEEFRSIGLPSELVSSPFINKATELYPLVDSARNGMAKIPGIFVLYIGGRFEDFVKTIFEEFSIKFAKKYTEYEKLPSKFKTAIINDTSQVISSPKKYGYRDGMQKVFITNLFNNVINDDFTNINHQCLSITEGNMRPEVLSDLFSKLAIKDIWTTIGQQTSIKTLFETVEAGFASNSAKKYLEDFMTKRNQVAHPSGGSLTWPSYDDVIKDIEFFKVLSTILLDLGNMQINSIPAQ